MINAFIELDGGISPCKFQTPTAILMSNGIFESFTDMVLSYILLIMFQEYNESYDYSIIIYVFLYKFISNMCHIIIIKLKDKFLS